MSEWSFTAQLNMDPGHPAQAILQALSKGCQPAEAEVWEQLSAKLSGTAVSADFLPQLRSSSVDVQATDTGLALYLDQGSEVSYRFFEDLVCLFEALEIEQYHARLFDSSSGGSQVWDQPPRELEFEDSRIFLLGDFDEEDEVPELVEGLGATLVDRVEGADIVVLGSQADPAIVAEANRLGKLILSEDELGDYAF